MSGNTSANRSARPGLTPSRPSGLSPLSNYDLGEHPRVFVRPEDVRAAGGGNAGIILSQMNFGMSMVQDHRKGFEVSRTDWSLYTGLTEHQVKRGFCRLRQRGLIVQRTRRGRANWVQPTTPSDRRENGDNRGVLVYAGLVRMSGNVDRGLILAQLCYWFGDGRSGRTRATIDRGGQWWVAKTHSELARETGLTSRQVRSAVDFLRGEGLIHVEHHLFRGRRCLHLRFDYETFHRLWDEQEVAFWER